MRLSRTTNFSATKTAQNIHMARFKVPIVSMMAPRPASLRMARVLPPLAAASVATFAMSFGLSASFRPSSAALVPALLWTRADVADELHEAVGLLDLHGLADGPHRGGRLKDRCVADRALEPPARSITSRTERPIQAAIWLLILPVLRAALTNVSPTRAGTAAPSDA